MEQEKLAEKIDKTIEKINEKDNAYVEIYKRKLDCLIQAYNDAQRTIAELNERLDRTEGLVNGPAVIPNWAIQTKTKKKISHNIPVLLVSDLHYGEDVNPNEVPDGNCYSPNVANTRFERLIENTILKTRAKGKTPQGIVICFLGDDISGDIHDELRETNFKTPITACVDVVDQKTKMIQAFEKEYGKVWVISVMGNHGRTTKKPQSKEIGEHNYDTLISAILQKRFASHKNITFYTPKSGEAYFDLYGYHFLATHGDRIGSRGGQGFIGPSATIARGQTKTRQAYAQLKKPIDWLLLGHFHVPMRLEHTIANGTLVGYSQYARDLRVEPAWPSQTLFYVDETYGVTDLSLIYVTNSEQIKHDRQIYFTKTIDKGERIINPEFVINVKNKQNQRD